MNKKDIFLGLIIAVSLALLISPFVSPWPDGLEKVAGDKGFAAKATNTGFTAPIRDYLWPGFKNEKLATSLAGTVGTLFVFTVGYALALLLRKKNK
ncbi:MAG: PDGLE domain-containing protein [Candidatus Omnitrophica bacterium]|nr:PDGLE domain-containing protein [Candidatus Omnitrophota bacterium]